MPFYESQEKTPLLPLTALVGRGGFAGYLLLGIEVMRVASIRGRDPSEYAEVDASALLQIIYVGLCLVYGVCRWARSPQRGAFYLLKATPVLPLVLYGGICALSSLWSPNPTVTFYRSMECLAYIVLIAIVCDNLNLRCSRQDFIEWIVLWSMWFLAWDIVRVIRVMGPGVFASSYAFRAGNFGLSMVFFLTLFVSKRRLFVLVSLVFMILSRANTAYFGIFLGLIPGLFAGGRKYHTALFFFVGLAVLAFLWIGPDLLQYTLFYGKPGMGISQTSGRDQIWRYALDYGENRLACGYGFVAGETEALRAAGAAAITTHNVFLSALLSVGVAGPLLFLIFFAWLAHASLRSDLPKNWRPAFLGTTIMVFATSIASPGLGARVYGAWVPSVLICTAISALSISDTLRELNALTMGWNGEPLLESAL
jgi:hypothetical protein